MKVSVSVSVLHIKMKVSYVHEIIFFHFTNTVSSVKIIFLFFV